MPAKLRTAWRVRSLHQSCQRHIAKVYTVLGEDYGFVQKISQNVVDSSILHMSVWPRRHISAPESATLSLERLGSAATSSRAGTSIASIS